MKEIKIGDTVFKIKKLSGYKLLKQFGANKDIADTYRDLILACVEEPKLSKKEVEEMDSRVFLKLGAEIIKLHAPDLKEIEDFLPELKQ